MSDQTTDPTAWSDDQLDELLDALADRAAERDDLDLPGSGASRRSVVAGLLGLGGAAAGVGALAGRVRAAPSYGNASGEIGTSSEPLSAVRTQSLRAQTATIDQSISAANIIRQPDSNSPFTASGANELNITSLDSFSKFLVTGTVTEQSGVFNNLQLQINGVTTSDYENFDATGSATTTTSISLTNMDNRDRVEVQFYLFEQSRKLVCENIATRTSTDAQHAFLSGPSSIDSIRLFRQGSAVADFDISVFGLE